MCPALAHVKRYICISFVVSLSLQIEHLLSLADQRAHASTFECVWMCSEHKIYKNYFGGSREYGLFSRA